MSTLWIFGDSFAVDYQHGSSYVLERQWHRLLRDRLGYNVEYRGERGAGLEHMYYTWGNEHNNMQPGDVAVVAVTDFNRRWFFPEHPHFGSMQAIPFEGMSNKQTKAVEMYFRFLFNPLFHPMLLENWLCNAHNVGAKGVRVVLLPGFKDTENFLSEKNGQFPMLHIARGHLWNISIKEHVEKFRKVRITKEGRPCHLTPRNHIALADKILGWIERGEPVDLTTGFYENVIDGRDLSSPTMFSLPHRLGFY